MKLKTLRKIFGRVQEMSGLAYLILMVGLLVSCACLGAALLLLLTSGQFSVGSYHSYQMVKELFSLPVSIMLIAIIGSACLEDLLKRQ